MNTGNHRADFLPGYLISAVVLTWAVLLKRSKAALAAYKADGSVQARHPLRYFLNRVSAF